MSSVVTQKVMLVSSKRITRVGQLFLKEYIMHSKLYTSNPFNINTNFYKSTPFNSGWDRFLLFVFYIISRYILPAKFPATKLGPTIRSLVSQYIKFLSTLKVKFYNQVRVNFGRKHTIIQCTNESKHLFLDYSSLRVVNFKKN